MMKLKYLFDNRDLANMLLANWEHDEDNHAALDGFRISANAVYPFYRAGALCFLRFAPVEEKPVRQAHAELAFLTLLRGRGYDAVEPVLSKDGSYIVERATPWGEYMAMAFCGVPGTRLDRLVYSPALYEGFGAAMGRLHAIGVGCTPGDGPPRADWRRALEIAEGHMIKNRAPFAALNEARALRQKMSALPRPVGTYGLIHGDFELDNVFFDNATGKYHIIDFDGAEYNWFIADIERALAAIDDELPKAHAPAARQDFIRGYRTTFEVSDDSLELLPLISRYWSLIGYASLLRSTAEKWANEPDWLVGLRKKLDAAMTGLLGGFGKADDTEQGK